MAWAWMSGCETLSPSATNIPFALTPMLRGAGGDYYLLAGQGGSRRVDHLITANRTASCQSGSVACCDRDPSWSAPVCAAD